ncbi:MAG TPA: outer membrane beta-barrel protein [Geothrix sp.]|nr:outer membrane beta-barrel protein [Geothrix sp.]
MRRMLAITFALAGLSLSAQNVTGGLQTGLTLPVGDLKDKTDFGTNQFFGTHIGGHLDFALTPHHEIRAQLTYHMLSGSDWGGPENISNDFKILQVGADWVYHFQSPNQGWYTVAGASINSVKADYTANSFSGSASQSGKLGVRGGGGYSFNQMFSLEGTLNQVMVDKNGIDGFGFDTATWVQVSAVFRFGR